MIVNVGADAGPKREARIRRYQERASDGLPLFDDGPPHGEQRGRRTCIACGSEAAMRRRGRMPDGWRVRRFTRMEEECHCPECFSRWGWGLFHPNDGEGEE